MNRNPWPLLAAAVTVLTISGCGPTGPEGPAIYPTTGTITLDGAPVSGATVEFVPVNVNSKNGLGGSGALGDTDASGQFVMYTTRYEGVQPGEYMVRVTKVETVLVDKELENYEERSMIPEKYGTEESGLTATIADEENTLSFELTSS